MIPLVFLRYFMTDLHQQFQQKNGMSVDQAWAFVEQWTQEGKIDQAKQGCEEILKFFPDHEANAFLQKLNSLEETSANPKEPLKKVIEKGAEHLQKMVGKENKNKEPPDETEKIVGALCYAHVFVLIPLFLKKDSAFVQFHAWQGVVLTLASIVLQIVFFNILFVGLWFFKFFLGMIILGGFAWGAYQAYLGKWNKLPMVYEVSEKLRKLFV